jgi:hypothetical protein
MAGFAVAWSASDDGAKRRFCCCGIPTVALGACGFHLTQPGYSDGSVLPIIIGIMAVAGIWLLCGLVYLCDGCESSGSSTDYDRRAQRERLMERADEEAQSVQQAQRRQMEEDRRAQRERLVERAAEEAERSRRRAAEEAEQSHRRAAEEAERSRRRAAEEAERSRRRAEEEAARTPWGGALRRVIEAERAATAARDYAKAGAAVDAQEQLRALELRGDAAVRDEKRAVSSKDWAAAESAKKELDLVAAEVDEVLVACGL